MNSTGLEMTGKEDDIVFLALMLLEIGNWERNWEVMENWR